MISGSVNFETSNIYILFAHLDQELIENKNTVNSIMLLDHLDNFINTNKRLINLEFKKDLNIYSDIENSDENINLASDATLYLENLFQVLEISYQGKRFLFPIGLILNISKAKDINTQIFLIAFLDVFTEEIQYYFRTEEIVNLVIILNIYHKIKKNKTILFFNQEKLMIIKNISLNLKKIFQQYNFLTQNKNKFEAYKMAYILLKNYYKKIRNYHNY